MELCNSDYYIVYRRKYSRIKNRPKIFINKKQGYYYLIAYKYHHTGEVYIQKIVSYKKYIKGRK